MAQGQLTLNYVSKEACDSFGIDYNQKLDEWVQDVYADERALGINPEEDGGCIWYDEKGAWWGDWFRRGPNYRELVIPDDLKDCFNLEIKTAD